MKLYLAGPEVFLANARVVLDAKAALARSYGFTPLKPGDIYVEHGPTPHQFGLKINAVDEQMMNEADGIIANLTPYRGLSADVGTSYELGYMCALGKKVAAYTNVADDFFSRCKSFYDGQITMDETGRWRGPDGCALENTEMIDNLMLHGGIARRGGHVAIHQASKDSLYSDLTGFEACLRFLAGQRDAEPSMLPGAQPVV